MSDRKRPDAAIKSRIFATMRRSPKKALLSNALEIAIENVSRAPPEPATATHPPAAQGEVMKMNARKPRHE
ncbi:hypothetical protein ACVILK_003870 [Bradyrhizobium embrapense]